ncbi:hypothetical protein D9M68_773270 [compost metagenome]
MLPFLWPSRARLSSSVTPAARSLLPKVCFRSCTRIEANPFGAGRRKRSWYFFAALVRAFFQAVSFSRCRGMALPCLSGIPYGNTHTGSRPRCPSMTDLATVFSTTSRSSPFFTPDPLSRPPKSEGIRNTLVSSSGTGISQSHLSLTTSCSREPQLTL